MVLLLLLERCYRNIKGLPIFQWAQAFDWFGSESHPDCGGNPATGEYRQNDTITAQQFANRMILRRAMLRHGFKPYDSEWWHFTLRNEPYPDTYFTFPVK